MTSERFILRGPKAFVAHASYIVALFLAFAGALYAQARTNGQTEGALGRLEVQIGDVQKTIQALRDERVALISQGNREKDQLRDRVERCEVRIDALMRDWIAARSGK